MSKEWVARLKNEVKESPFYSNAIIGFLMVGLEKLMEMDFACPCNPAMNRVFSAMYFVIPALFSSALMFYIQSPQCKTKCPVSFLTCIIPAAVWIMLLLFDGQYYACAKTSWEGLTVHTDISASTTWCQPLINPNNITEKQMTFFGFRNTSQTCWNKQQEARTEVDDQEMGDLAQRSVPPPEQSSLIEDESRAHPHPTVLQSAFVSQKY
ncbi:uncharacterized protein LOC125243792 isoform X2 [Megalobrama amblycephala]|uniref:uncharacterized protein LOC125243792 isoform X2 n=1 Tax=Megalobrama amblycephala TaxID=75352 RepID=UPI002013DC33|nr:uncharacterized protein LOC125243792 isoform X2 [Megalobrama amblycephala]